PTTAELLAAVDDVIERVLEVLRRTTGEELLATRGVGRAQLPSTVIGLLFHIAEHTQRHTGQVITTAKIVRRLGASA
ncbi:MAG: DinB family protein, partial [Longimicrobiales bacterium]